MNLAKLTYLRRAFKTPERFLSATFTKIAIIIAKFPVIFLSSFLVIAFATIFVSFYFYEIDYANLNHLYRPKKYVKYLELDDAISKNWAEYKNDSIVLRYDKIRLLLYDLNLTDVEDKWHLIYAIDEICSYIMNYNMSGYKSNEFITYESVKYIIPEELGGEEIPEACDLAQQFMASDLATQEIALV